MIVRKDGHILTNNHVVGDADEVNVTLADKRQLPAKVVGTDQLTDLAVLKIDVEGLTAAQLGNSSTTEVGEWVIAIGSPFGLDQTVTCGIISATGRAHMGLTEYEDFLQTDAAINPGNSGGPLVNLRGEVIGINTAIASRSGSYMGVGFSIPSDQARSVLESILKDGHVTRGWLGAAIQDLTPELAKSFDSESHSGVLIDDVVPKSPADAVGLKAGDIVARFAGKVISSASQLRNAVAALPPGTKADIEIIRDGKPLRLSITLGVLDENHRIQAAPSKSNSTNALGLTVQNLTPDLATQFGIDDEKGVVVTDVEPGSLAAQAGIQSGDLILAIGRQSIETLKDFSIASRSVDLESGVRMQIKSKGVRRFVYLRGTKR